MGSLIEAVDVCLKSGQETREIYSTSILLLTKQFHYYLWLFCQFCHETTENQNGYKKSCAKPLCMGSDLKKKKKSSKTATNGANGCFNKWLVEMQGMP